MAMIVYRRVYIKITSVSTRKWPEYVLKTQVIQFDQTLSPIVGGHLNIERVTFSSSQKGHVRRIARKIRFKKTCDFIVATKIVSLKMLPPQKMNKKLSSALLAR